MTLYTDIALEPSVQKNKQTNKQTDKDNTLPHRTSSIMLSIYQLIHLQRVSLPVLFPNSIIPRLSVLFFPHVLSQRGNTRVTLHHSP